MDNKAYFMIVHNRLKNSDALKSGHLLPSQQESENNKKKVEEEKKGQHEVFEKQKNELLTHTK